MDGTGSGSSAKPDANGHYDTVSRRTILKILAFEAGGFWVWGKRLEGGLFARAGSAEVRKTALSRTELLALIDGLDMKVVRRRKRWVKDAAR